jgi:hypothetical protein
MMWRRHPNATRLQAWLDHGDPSRVGRHVDRCDRCLAALEELSDLDDSIVADIAEVLAPPHGIEDHTSTQLERRLRNEDALMTFFDLFAAGWDVARTIFHTEEEFDD